MNNIEETIKRAVIYLGEVQQVVYRYYRLHADSGISLFSLGSPGRKAKALAKDVQEMIEADDKKLETERRKAEDDARGHLLVLHRQVYDWWDLIEQTEDPAKGERLGRLAEAAVQWIDRLEGYLRISYDTLRDDNTPRESSDRSRCHPRHSDETWNAIDEIREVVSCPEALLGNLPCQEFGEYEDEETAWAVNAAYRMATWLRHWVEEEMTEKVFRHYVYGVTPCSDRLECVIARAGNMDDLLTYWQFHNPELSKTLRTLYEAIAKAAKKTDRHYKRLSILPWWNERDFDPIEVKACAARLHDKLLQVGSMGLRSLEGAKQSQDRKTIRTPNGPEEAGGQKRKVTGEEANIEVRRLLKETPSSDWTVKKLADKIGCSTGLISKCPAWKVYNERRGQVRKDGTIKTVSLTSEMETVLGAGDKDEVLRQLVAEQEGDAREEARQAKLYLSHEKKPKRRES